MASKKRAAKRRAGPIKFGNGSVIGGAAFMGVGSSPDLMRADVTPRRPRPLGKAAAKEAERLAGLPPTLASLGVGPRSIAEDATLLQDFSALHTASARLLELSEEDAAREVLAKRGWTPEAIDRILAGKQGMLFAEVRDEALRLIARDELHDRRDEVLRQLAMPRLLVPAGTLGPTTNAVTAVGDVQQGVATLVRAIDRMEETIMDLASRLQPVLRDNPPAPPATMPSDIDPPQSTAIGSEVIDQARRARSLRNRLGEIIDRLGI